MAVHLPLPGLVRQPPDTMVGLTSPAHMFRKFGWEIRQLTSPRRDPNENPYEAQLNGYRAFNCAVTGWQIAPWTWNCSDGGLRAEIAARSTRTEGIWNVFAKPSQPNVPSYTFAAGSRMENTQS